MKMLKQLDVNTLFLSCYIINHDTIFIYLFIIIIIIICVFIQLLFSICFSFFSAYIYASDNIDYQLFLLLSKSFFCEEFGSIFFDNKSILKQENSQNRYE